VMERTSGAGILWCDGRRSHDLPPGARVEVSRSNVPVKLARLHPTAFTNRIVEKFHLPVEGWRGSSVRGQS
jgi:NAD+ kinase